MLDKTDQPLVVDRIEEPGNIGVQYPVHSRVADPDGERVQCIMRTAAGPEPIREPEEIFLVDRVGSTNSDSGRPMPFAGSPAVGSEEARSTALALASVRRSNWACSFPAPSFHKDAGR